MAEAQKRSASRSRSSGGSKASSNGRSSSPSARSRRASSGAASRSRTARSRGSTSRANGPQNRRQNARSGGGIGGAIKTVGVPIATAAAGIVGGVVLGRRNRRPHKILGVPIPGTASGLNGLASEVRKAGKQFGKLASEVQTTRKKAEDIGKALS